jgi:hypothetical protein
VSCGFFPPKKGPDIHKSDYGEKRLIHFSNAPSIGLFEGMICFHANEKFKKMRV